MDNNFDNTPKDNDTSWPASGEPNTGEHNSGTDQQPESGSGRQYTDPNAGQQPYNNQQYQYGNAYNYNQQQNGYNYNQQNQQNQQYGYNQQNGYNYQDNYNYNTGYNTQYNQTYEPGQDTSPMSMGDWILTLLAAMIPCVGIILYFVWAFSKTTNVNRRNFCRAELVIAGVVIVIYLIFAVLFGSMLFSSGLYY